ncbi:MAG: transposase, partial [Candidatus Dechloromonas phosphoritropha]
VSTAHEKEFMLMVADGASSHVSKDLQVPENIRLLRLPPYAPQLNPQEHVWDEVREKEFHNRVFADLGSVSASWKQAFHVWQQIPQGCAA